jgi:hypothetical protein
MYTIGVVSQNYSKGLLPIRRVLHILAVVFVLLTIS